MDNLTEKLEMPYFKVFPKDELTDSRIQLLTLEELGAYYRLKNQIWIDGGYLPFDKEILRKILRISPGKFKSIWEKISPLFSIVDEKLTTADFERQRAKYNVYIQQKRDAGKKSAEDRAKKNQRSLNDTNTHTESKSKSETNTHTQIKKDDGVCGEDSEIDGKPSLSNQDAISTNGASPKKESEFTFDERLKYAEICKARGSNVSNPSGLADYLKDGDKDNEIRQTLYPERHAQMLEQADQAKYGAPRKFSSVSCSVCHGSKMELTDRGARRCEHCLNERGAPTDFEPVESIASVICPECSKTTDLCDCPIPIFNKNAKTLYKK